MSQATYLLADQTHAQLRAALNVVLAAIQSWNSGGSAPSLSPHKVWMDETAGLVKQCNAAGDAWVIIGDLGMPYWGMSTTAYVDAVAAALAAAYAGADGAHVAAADPHAGYIKHALALAGNDFLIASGAGVIVKKTLAETQAILGIAGLTHTTNYLTGDVALTLADTFYNGPSLSLPAGTWLTSGLLTLKSTVVGNRRVTAKLLSGATVIAAPEANIYASGGDPIGTIVIPGIPIVLVATTTVKVQAACTVTNTSMLATPPDNNGGCANKASFIAAVKIA